MAYCRFFDSDAYIFANIDGGFTCVSCSLEQLGDASILTLQELQEHVVAHRAAGDSIPERVDEMIAQDIADMEFLERMKNPAKCPHTGATAFYAQAI